MNRIFQKLKIMLFTRPRSGWSISSAAAEHDHHPKPTRVYSSSEVDEKTPEPDGDGWVKMGDGLRIRKIKNGMGSDISPVEDAPGRQQPASRGWQTCRKCNRRVPERLRGGKCEWCRGE